MVSGIVQGYVYTTTQRLKSVVYIAAFTASISFETTSAFFVTALQVIHSLLHWCICALRLHGELLFKNNLHQSPELSIFSIARLKLIFPLFIFSKISYFAIH